MYYRLTILGEAKRRYTPYFLFPGLVQKPTGQMPAAAPATAEQGLVAADNIPDQSQSQQSFPGGCSPHGGHPHGHSYAVDVGVASDCQHQEGVTSDAALPAHGEHHAPWEQHLESDHDAVAVGVASGLPARVQFLQLDDQWTRP